ncbi:MAG: hypothetical protein ACYS21_12690 [Planctomycetota bacterium]|jgi:hypothetical protein
MMEEVKIAVMDKYKAHPGLTGALTGGLFFQQAPQYSDEPYGVFYIMGGSYEEIMGTADDNITEVVIQFNLFSAALDGGQEMSDMVDELLACYSWQTLDVTGYNCLKMQPNEVPRLSFVNDVSQASMTYSLGIQKE